MPESVVVGNAQITVADDGFLTGFYAGRFHYRSRCIGKPLTDLELYHFISQAIYDVRLTDRTNAGYVAGFISAMHEYAPQEQRGGVTLSMLESSGG